MMTPLNFNNRIHSKKINQSEAFLFPYLLFTPHEIPKYEISTFKQMNFKIFMPDDLNGPSGLFGLRRTSLFDLDVLQ